MGLYNFYLLKEGGMNANTSNQFHLTCVRNVLKSVEAKKTREMADFRTFNCPLYRTI